MHGVHCEKQFDSHFHPSLLIVIDEEVHLFFWVLCKTFECTTLDINLAVVGYKLSEALFIAFIEIFASIFRLFRLFQAYM